MLRQRPLLINMCALSAQGPSTLLKALAVRLGGGRCPICQLEEELLDVSREIDYFSEVLRYMAREQSSPQLLGPLRAP